MDSPVDSPTTSPAPTNEKKRFSESSSPYDQGNHTDDIAFILSSIEVKLTNMDARISLIELVHNEISALRHSLEFSQHQIETLTNENKTLKDSVSSFNSQLATVTADCKTMKETILDLQSRSMRDNLVFSGVPEVPAENTEQVVKDLITTRLKLPTDTVLFTACTGSDHHERTTNTPGQ